MEGGGVGAADRAQELEAGWGWGVRVSVRRLAARCRVGAGLAVVLGCDGSLPQAICRGLFAVVRSGLTAVKEWAPSRETSRHW